MFFKYMPDLQKIYFKENVPVLLKLSVYLRLWFFKLLLCDTPYLDTFHAV